MALNNFLAPNLDNSLSGVKWHLFKQSIIKSLLNLGNVTITELCTELNSSTPTMKKAMTELVKDGLVIDLGKIVNSGGRRPSLFTISPTCAYFLGIEVNRASLSICLQNIKNEIVAIELNKHFILQNTQESLESLCSLINSFINDSKIDKSYIIGSCINLSGRINSKEGFSYNFFYSENRPLAEIISEQIGLSVFLENDSRAMTFGEYKQGVVDKEQDVIFVNYSWGVGIGIIADGRLYYGKSGYSGEFGHNSLFDNEKMCQCGKVGCLETEVSGWALVDQFKGAVAQGRISSVNIEDKSTILQHNKIIEGAIIHEDNLCIELITKQSEKMGRYLANLLNIFNPEVLIIGGDFSQLGDFVLLPIQSALKKHTLGLVSRDAKLKKSALGRRAGVIGACSIVKEKTLSSML